MWRVLIPALALAAVSAGCVVNEDPRYRGPNTVVVPQNQTIEQHNTINSKTKIKSTVNSTSTSTTNIQTNHPEATIPGQQADPTVEKFDKDGNPNYDADGNYIGGHGIGTTVDNPDAPAETGSNPEPEPEAVPEPAADPEPAPEPEPAADSGDSSDGGEESE